MDPAEHQRILDIIGQKDQAPLDLPRGATALLVIDMQRCFVRRDANFPEVLERLAPGATQGYFERVAAKVVPNVARLLDGFRRAGAPVIFTGTGTQDGTGADLAGWLQGFDSLGAMLLGDRVWPRVGEAAWQIDPSVEPLPSETVLHKQTADPFLSTDLGTLLANLGTRTVVVAGLTTDVCVSATARAAADRGHVAVVAEDACTTLSEAMHRSALDAIALAFGRVKTTDSILSLLAGPEQAAPMAAGPAIQA